MLNELIDDVFQDEATILMWNNLIPSIKNNLTIITHEITRAEAYRYRFDLYGILKNILYVPEDLIYPNYLLNNCKCSTDFKGEVLNIYTGSKEELYKYLTVYQSHLD